MTTGDDDMSEFKQIWDNTVYRYTCVYAIIVLTLIFGLQVYRYFYALPATKVDCVTVTESSTSAWGLVPVIGPWLAGLL